MNAMFLTDEEKTLIEKIRFGQLTKSFSSNELDKEKVFEEVKKVDKANKKTK